VFLKLAQPMVFLSPNTQQKEKILETPETGSRVSLLGIRLHGRERNRGMDSGSWDSAEAGGGFGRVCWRWEVRAGGSGQKKKRREEMMD